MVLGCIREKIVPGWKWLLQVNLQKIHESMGFTSKMALIRVHDFYAYTTQYRRVFELICVSIIFYLHLKKEKQPRFLHAYPFFSVSLSVMQIIAWSMPSPVLELVSKIGTPHEDASF
jgi:hypothetical protein